MPAGVQRAAVIGDGAMGTLCSLLLARRGAEVTLWGVSPQQVATLAKDRENKRYLPGHALPPSVHVSDDPTRAFAGCDLIVSAVPCQYMRPVWRRLCESVPGGVPIVSVAKGIEVGTLLRPTGIIADCLGGHHVSLGRDSSSGTTPLACLSGPSIAPEIAAGKPATVVVASDGVNVARLVQVAFSSSRFRVYTSTDLIGVELAGAAKNVIALAAGIGDGMGAGDNAKASLLTRGLAEITRLGADMGARAETFLGLAGVGDLVTTCISKISRNRTAGERIGKGETVEQVIASTPSVIEGIPTTRSVLELAARSGVEMPIVSAMACVLFEGRRPADAIDELMSRRLKDE